MSQFLNSLKDRLTVVEQEMQSLPGELDSMVARLDTGKLRSLLSRLDQDCNELYDKKLAAERSGALVLPIILQLSPPYTRQITDEDWSRWRESYKSTLQVVIGKGRVEVMAPSKLAQKYKTTVSQTIHVARQQGDIVLGWDEYQKLFGEIAKLIGRRDSIDEPADTR